MNKFNASVLATEIMTNVLTTKTSAGVSVQIGRKNHTLREIILTKAFKGYDAVRKSINRQTEKYFNEDCVIVIGGNRMEFKGGKFSNELLKMLERATTEFFNTGDHINEDANFKANLNIIKTTFLNGDMTIVDLLPIAMKFGGLERKQLALLGEALATNDSFKDAVSDTLAYVETVKEFVKAKRIPSNG